MGRDALTPAEIATAREVAVDAALRAETTDVTGAPGPELLSVALAEGEGPRRAAVLLYDYRGDRLIKRVIDLAGRTVAGHFSATDRQPPPADREVAATAARATERSRCTARIWAPATRSATNASSTSPDADPGRRLPN